MPQNILKIFFNSRPSTFQQLFQLMSQYISKTFPDWLTDSKWQGRVAGTKKKSHQGGSKKEEEEEEERVKWKGLPEVVVQKKLVVYNKE